ncbi:hypothetical protein P7K49_012954 [Saguinus oedipus]|uniref:Uncharacterized protein n=1 Tax=Saguinus oedipus TaxID=9490 RepID=A0ABQ9VEI4_SAGOE|nr:hypothetical protein P7K49_012954 [Saguinus oedipus]
MIERTRKGKERPLKPLPAPVSPPPSSASELPGSRETAKQAGLGGGGLIQEERGRWGVDAGRREEVEKGETLREMGGGSTGTPSGWAAFSSRTADLAAALLRRAGPAGGGGAFRVRYAPPPAFHLRDNTFCAEDPVSRDSQLAGCETQISKGAGVCAPPRPALLRVAGGDRGKLLRPGRAQHGRGEALAAGLPDPRTGRTHAPHSPWLRPLGGASTRAHT